MNRSSSFQLISSITCGCVLAMAGTGSAVAAWQQRAFYQNGGNACTGALPTYEGSLRKRPKAIANEGLDMAFVTCAATNDALGDYHPGAVTAGVTNRGSAPIDLSCTFVNGDEVNGASYVVATKTLPVGQLVEMQWTPLAPATEFDRAAVGISCRLPPSVEVNYFLYLVQEDVGN